MTCQLKCSNVDGTLLKIGFALVTIRRHVTLAKTMHHHDTLFAASSTTGCSMTVPHINCFQHDSPPHKPLALGIHALSSPLGNIPHIRLLRACLHAKRRNLMYQGRHPQQTQRPTQSAHRHAQNSRLCGYGSLVMQQTYAPVAICGTTITFT